MKTPRFPEKVERILRQYGWTGRLRDIEEIPLPKGYPPFPAAEKVLREFAGLHIGRCDTGIECATRDFEIDPVDAVGENLDPDDRAPNGLRVYPLGTFCNSHGLLYIDEEGVVYYTWLRLLVAANTFDDAVVRMLLGLKFVEQRPKRE